MKKFVKISLFICFLTISLGAIALGVYFACQYNKFSSTPLNEEKLLSHSQSISIFDTDNKPIKEENTTNSNYVKISSIPKHTQAAFVAIEDKDFYTHHGVNYKRMAKAALNNVKSKSFKEGASTITQQLIKNTHLTNEKTIDRKLKEIALAKKLEKKFSKDEILEHYLNVIYFGNNCYGIEDAANYYFSKSTKDLTIDESALLAGMIKSPNRYSPIKNPQRSLERRNLVLDQMTNDGHITLQELLQAKDKPIDLKLTSHTQNKLNCYSEAAIDEASKILGLPAKQIALRGYKIYTYYDQEKQNALEKAFNDSDTGGNDYAGIVLDNNKSAVVAYTGKSAYKILEAKRQPGSCIKPILVYAPALNEDLIYPCSQLLDEKTTIAGYSPKNVNDTYKGYVSAREALSRSINIPAIKVLSYVGIDKAKAYSNEMGIEFDEKDDSYALALGGMNYGVNIASLAGAYQTIANGGIYSSPRFVSYITDANNRLVYIHKKENKRVLREDASYLLTDMLKTCAQSGTAKKLADITSEVASKTGTVGKPNSKQNLDAWNMTYSKNATVGVWIGNLDNRPISIAGGGAPTQIVKNYYLAWPDEDKFEKPSSITEQMVDDNELASNHRVVLANTFTPERYCHEELFSRFNLPNEISKKFVELENPNFKCRLSGSQIAVNFDAKEYITYKLYCDGKLLKTIEGREGKQVLTCDMKNEKQNILLEYYFTNQPNISKTENSTLIKTQKTAKSKWYV